MILISEVPKCCRDSCSNPWPPPPTLSSDSSAMASRAQVVCPANATTDVASPGNSSTGGANVASAQHHGRMAKLPALNKIVARLKSQLQRGQRFIHVSPVWAAHKALHTNVLPSQHLSPSNPRWKPQLAVCTFVQDTTPEQLHVWADHHLCALAQHCTCCNSRFETSVQVLHVAQTERGVQHNAI